MVSVFIIVGRNLTLVRNPPKGPAHHIFFIHSICTGEAGMYQDAYGFLHQCINYSPNHTKTSSTGFASILRYSRKLSRGETFAEW